MAAKAGDCVCGPHLLCRYSAKMLCEGSCLSLQRSLADQRKRSQAVCQGQWSLRLTRRHRAFLRLLSWDSKGGKRLTMAICLACGVAINGPIVARVG